MHRARQVGAVFVSVVALGWVGRGIVWVAAVGETAETVVVSAFLLLGLVVGVLSARDLEPYTEREVRDTRSGLLFGGLIVATVVGAFVVSRAAF